MVKSEAPKIAVVLNAFKRTKYLYMQLDAIEGQTIKPESIYVWQNKGEVIDEKLKSRFILAECSENLGVWARFAFALNIDADYICVFDDDTIPGERWFENCIETMKTHEGLLGTRGLRYMNPKRYHPFEHYGWGNANEETMQVDIVGHAWFFKREHLAMFWSEMPPKDSSKIAGEDIHFSYMLQKFGLGTYVPPHPENDKSLWGSLPEYGKDIGMDENAISSDETALSRFDVALRYYTKRGFTLYLSGSERLKKGIVVGSGVRTNKVFRKVASNNPLIKKMGKRVLSMLEKLGIHI
ncbi:glycosyltransferase [Vibrio salinus]|uniref:glycosyltransferase n=1 Tax=Vibrio salinus TaxID=2899784 RepID=UPI001E4F2826|nr:glycosyltransferase [Vibrio salinus]MCE0493767.1 glycosyltransferase [Vibrio salinus]